MTDPGVPDSGLESYVPAAPGGPPVPQRPPWRKAGIAIGVVVALLAGLFGFAALTSDGGQESPEAAVQKLVDALENEDVLGALEALVPAERAVLRGRTVELGDQLRRLGIVDDRLDLAHVAGADLTVEGVELSSERLGPDVAAVRATKGSATLRIRGEELPIGPLLEDLVADPGAIESPPPVDLSDEEVVVVAVRRDGDWFVSLGYTAAELARRDSGREVPKFGDGVVPKGSSSPEEAVRELASAAAALDVRRVIELTPPGEADALHDYAPLFLPAAERAAAEMRDQGVRVEVPTLELDAAPTKGGEARVTVKRLTVKVTSGQDPFVFDYDGRCVKIGGLPEDGVPPMCRDSESEDQPFPDAAFSYFELTTVERGGSWFVSPAGSLLDALIGTLRTLEREELAEAVKKQPYSLFYLFYPTPFLYGSSMFTGGGSYESGEETVTAPARPLELDAPARPLELDAPVTSLPADAAPAPHGQTAVTGESPPP